MNLFLLLSQPEVALEGPVSISLAVYGSALAAVIAVLWALLERAERRVLQRQNSELLLAFREMTTSHYGERVKAEERHSLELDSSMRNVLEHFERALLGKPKA